VRGEDQNYYFLLLFIRAVFARSLALKMVRLAFVSLRSEYPPPAALDAYAKRSRGRCLVDLPLNEVSFVRFLLDVFYLDVGILVSP
jgi:hypothetical protein